MKIINSIGEIDKEINENSLINEDCLKIMPYIKSKTINMILADLPYGVTQNPEDKVIPFSDLWREYERIIKDDGIILLFGQGLFYIDLVNSNRKLFKYDIVWDKILTSGFLNAKRQPLRVHENIAVFYRKKPTYNPQFSEGKPLHSKGTSYMNKEHKNQNYGKFNMTDDSNAGNTKKYPKSLISFQKPHPSNAKHRTEKPVKLLEYLIKTYSNENDLVLDNVFGSGSTIKACINTNRKFIGIEKSKEEFDRTIKELQENYNF